MLQITTNLDLPIQLDNGRWRGGNCPDCGKSRIYKTRSGAKSSLSNTCRDCYHKKADWKEQFRTIESFVGHELPDGRWRGADCPQCGAERTYSNKWSAERNKERPSCKRCNRIKWFGLGARVGNWVIIGGPEFNVGGCESRPQGYIKWLCRCDRCGVEKLVNSSSLNRGLTRGCADCRFPPEGVANFNASYGQKIKSAKERNLEWELDEAQYAFLVSQPCVYCGKLNSNNHRVHKGEFLSNGIDRINSNAGYTLTNVTTSCKACNYAKRKMTTREFAQWVCNASGHPDEVGARWDKWAERIRTITKTLLYVCELGNGCLTYHD